MELANKTKEQNISPCSSQRRENVEENEESLKIFCNKYVIRIFFLMPF